MTTLKFLPDEVWYNKLCMWIKGRPTHPNTWQVDMVVRITSLAHWSTSLWVEELAILFMLHNEVMWGTCMSKPHTASIASGNVAGKDVQSKWGLHLNS